MTGSNLPVKRIILTDVDRELCAKLCYALCDRSLLTFEIVNGVCDEACDLVHLFKTEAAGGNRGSTYAETGGMEGFDIMKKYGIT